MFLAIIYKKWSWLKTRPRGLRQTIHQTSTDGDYKLSESVANKTTIFATSRSKSRFSGEKLSFKWRPTQIINLYASFITRNKFNVSSSSSIFAQNRIINLKESISRIAASVIRPRFFFFPIRIRSISPSAVQWIIDENIFETFPASDNVINIVLRW